MRFIFIGLTSFLILYLCACRDNEDSGHNQHSGDAKQAAQYTCAMHPQILKDQPGQCPICGMALIKKESKADTVQGVRLESLLQPTNQYVVSGIPVTAIKQDQVTGEIDAYGTVEYDTRMIGSVSAKVSGRIEKLYVRYKYQYIKKGQKIMDVYSPELLTAQQNLLFLTHNDANNVSLLEAARQKLLLLGMGADQLQHIIKSGKPIYAVSVISKYNGHLHNAGAGSETMNDTQATTSMPAVNLSTEAINMREGMYIQRGQTLFNILDPSRAWAVLNMYKDGQVKKGQLVKIVPEAAPGQFFQGQIDFIEPFYRSGSRTTSARVYFDNSRRRLPIGSQVRASILSNSERVNWLPKESVTSLGIDKIVFLRKEQGFQPRKVTTGVTDDNRIQIIRGLSETDSVAIQAQYLIDSESFIKLKE